MKRNALLLLVCFLLCGQGWGQEETPPQDSRIPTQDISVSVVPSGMRRQVPTRWAMMAVNGTNPTDQETEEIVTVSVGDDGLQFARRFWMPANSRRQTWLPVLIPDVSTNRQLQMPMKSIHLKKTADGETFQSNKVGQPISQRNLLLSSEVSRAAGIFRQKSNTNKDEKRFRHLVNEVQGFRDRFVTSEQDLGLIQYVSHALPAGPQGLASIDQLVIGGDRFRNDSAAGPRIMNWVRDGGRLWVMIDQLSEDAIHELLGTEICFAPVSRVEMNDFTAQASGAVSGSSKWASDDPVSMVRVFAEDAEIECKIDGWPAVFWKSLGEGEILFTTIGPRGLHDSNGILPVVRSAIGRFFAPRIVAERNPAETLRPFMDREIGYSIPTRSTIGIVLGGQCFIILLAGAWLARRKQLHYFAALVPVVSILAAGFLLISGFRNSTATESTIATGQFVQVSKDGSRASVGSSTAIYSQDGQSINLSGSEETIMLLDQKESTGDLKRILWTDDGRSQWDDLKQPPGVVRHCTSESAVTLPKRTFVVGRFSKRGFEAEIKGIDAQSCENALVLSDSMPALALTPESNGDQITFFGNPESVLLRDQFNNQSFVDDQARNRQDILRNLTSSNSALFGSDPVLLAWTPPLDTGLKFDARFSKRGTALVSIPIQYERPATGAEFVVPSNFVRLDASVGERGISMIFNAGTGKWMENLTRASSIVLDCQLPESLLPCDLSSVNLDLKISAPSRTLTMECLDSEGNYRELFRQANPKGAVELVVDDPKLLGINDRGGWRLKIAVSKAEGEKASKAYSPALEEQRTNRRPTVRRTTDPSQQVAWQIDFLRVSATGTTQ